MNYYLTIVQNNSTCAVYKYTNYDEALSAMHTELAYRGVEGDPSYRTQTLCILMDETGGIMKSEFWHRQGEGDAE